MTHNNLSKHATSPRSNHVHRLKRLDSAVLFQTAEMQIDVLGLAEDGIVLSWGPAKNYYGYHRPNNKLLRGYNQCAQGHLSAPDGPI
jgi:hypothetical protein